MKKLLLILCGAILFWLAVTAFVRMEKVATIRPSAPRPTMEQRKSL